MAASHCRRWAGASWSCCCLAFLALIVEGAMYDWTAVYMRDVAMAGGGFVSAGYAAFSIGMAAGRFTGDPVRARFSEGALVATSCALCISGLDWR